LNKINEERKLLGLPEIPNKYLPSLFGLAEIGLHVEDNDNENSSSDENDDDNKKTQEKNNDIISVVKSKSNIDNKSNSDQEVVEIINNSLTRVNVDNNNNETYEEFIEVANNNVVDKYIEVIDGKLDNVSNDENKDLENKINNNISKNNIGSSGNKFFHNPKIIPTPILPFCVYKPNVVFFGEDLPVEFYFKCKEDLPKCDLMVVIGSSLKVSPVCDIISDPSLPADVPRILINKEMICLFSLFFFEHIIIYISA
jgi:hypothetical protein